MTQLTPLQEALAPRSDQLNADDLIAGPRTLKITGARIVEGDRGIKRITLNYEGDNGKPFKPCKTMGRAMVMVWGITDEAQMIGKSITVYRDPDVDFGPDKGIGGIRISHMSHIDGPKSIKLTVSQGKRKPFVFQPLTAEVTPMPKQRQTAAQWAEAHTEAIDKCDTADALDTLCNRAAKAMGKLAEEHPDTHQALMSAADARRAELTRDGRADEDMGEGFTDFDPE